MKKLSMGMMYAGLFSVLMAVVARMLMRPLLWVELESRSFGAFAAVLFLACIAINTAGKD